MNSIKAIVERSSSIWERLTGAFVAQDDPSQDDLTQLRLEKWMQSVASGSPDLFIKRFGRENLTIEQVTRAMIPVHLSENQPLPGWSRTLQQLIESATYVTETPAGIAFSEVLTPMVQIASSKLKDAAGDFAFYLLSNAAKQQIELQLMNRLSRICTPAIASELNLARCLGRLEGETPEERSQYFLRTKLGSPDALLNFFCEYSVLARLLAIYIDQWVDSMAEFLQRLHSDIHDIELTFNKERPAGYVVELNDSLSDSHNGGRTVKAIIFQSGLKLLYKPKECGIDLAFMKLLKWLNEQEPQIRMRTFDLLDKNTYAWAEFVECEPCKNLIEANEYYHRSGVLLCLLYVLGTTDAHLENVVAAADGPVLVDMEMLLRVPVHSGDEESRNDAAQLAIQLREDSVLSTGLLPEWRFGRQGRPGMDGGGLTGEGRQESPFPRIRWTGINSDHVQANVDYALSKPSANRPFLRDQPIHAGDYVNEITRGFEQMYRFVLKERGRFCSSTPFAELFSHRIRYLNRPTLEYSMILERSLDVDCLRDGVNRSIRLDLLSRSLLNHKRDHMWPLMNAERESLERLDIPYFLVPANSTALQLDTGRELQDFFEMSAQDLLKERLEKLSFSDMQKQIALIHASFQTQGVNTGKKTQTELPDWREQQPLSREVLLETSAEIGNRLMENAIRSDNGTATWLEAEFQPHSQQFRLAPMSIGLYGGLSGVVLFLSALERFLPGKGYGDFSAMAIKTLRLQRKASRPDLLINQFGYGGMTGIASVAYSLAWASRFSNETAWMREAIEWASLITKEAMESVPSFDFLSGAAGAVPALLRLYQFSEDASVLERAIDCGRHILNRSGSVQKGLYLSGFSHGASGIGYALFLLYKACGNKEFLSAASDAFAYESTLFSPEKQNWPDLRKGEIEETFKTSWCHGAPGIALSRLASLQELPHTLTDLAVAIKTTENHGVQDIDDLCCGNCGRIDILLTAGRRLAQKEFCESAARQMSAVIRRRCNDSYAYNSSLFKGAAGIGYTCLRLVDTEKLLPSVLLLE